MHNYPNCLRLNLNCKHYVKTSTPASHFVATHWTTDLQLCLLAVNDSYMFPYVHASVLAKYCSKRSWEFSFSVSPDQYALFLTAINNIQLVSLLRDEKLMSKTKKTTHKPALCDCFIKNNENKWRSIPSSKIARSFLKKITSSQREQRRRSKDSCAQWSEDALTSFWFFLRGIFLVVFNV